MVSANQTRIAVVLASQRRLRVPLYQRKYAWKRDDWRALWNDVAQLALDRLGHPTEKHFVGSVVLAPPPDKNDAARLIIDGQQRLVTTSLLLCAIRDGQQTLPVALRRRINRCLLVSSDVHLSPMKRLRLLPTQSDQNAFSRVVNGQECEDRHQITLAYQFFAKRIHALHQGEDENIEGVAVADLARAALDGLECVCVVADESDNVHRIFESLNNRGQPLTQADLIRNYVFMRLSSHASDFHEFTWQPLEDKFSSEELTQLFWLDLVRDRPSITQRQTYVEQQKKLHKLTKRQLKGAIRQVACRADLWERILHPEKEASKPVGRRLERLAAWKTTTAWPALMYLLEERQKEAATSLEISKAMLYLESYFVRRVVVGRATDNMNRVLLAVPQALKNRDEPVDVAIRRYLSGDKKHWATDEELRQLAATRAFYNHGKAFQKTLILSWIEVGLAGDEYVLADDFTVEHVMPQTVTPAWRVEIKRGSVPGENVDHVHAGLVHTLGNLTLARAGRNSGMSNKSFAEKKALLARWGSGLKITREITKKKNWGPAEIRKRSDAMVDRIVKAWPGPLQD